MRVLLVEDDNGWSEVLARALDRYQIATRHVRSGCDALASLADADLVLLDSSLPDIHGIDICRQIRLVEDVPIILISGYAEVRQCILGLWAGADDYVVKPFDTDELVARMHAVCRRTGRRPASRSISFQDVFVDLGQRIVEVAGERVRVPQAEFKILEVLAEEPGQIYTRRRLVAELWGKPWSGARNTLTVHVATLRARLKRPALIETVWGIGYKLSAHATIESR